MFEFRVSCRQLLAFVCFALVGISTGRPQIINVTDATSTPVPGSGHNYLRMLSETVNPANGSVSTRIQLPVPPGRQLTLPFAISYDSNGVLFFEALGNASGGWTNDRRAFAQGGWHLTVPMISDVHTQRVSGQYGQYVCQYYTGYVFYDAKGVRHPMGSPTFLLPTPPAAPTRPTRFFLTFLETTSLIKPRGQALIRRSPNRTAPSTLSPNST